MAQEGAGSENFLLRKQEFTVWQCGGLSTPGIIDGSQERVRGLVVALLIKDHEVVIRALIELNVKRPEPYEINGVPASLSNGV